MKIFRTIKKEEGVAFIMVLVIAAVVLVIMTSMIYMLTIGTRISGMAKRYTTAAEAARGGTEIVRAMVDFKDSWTPTNLAPLIDNTSGEFSGVHMQLGNAPCASLKLQNSTDQWGTCDGSDIIDINDRDTYDYVFDMGDYKVYSKITYTIQGNSAGTHGGGWKQMGVVYSSGYGSAKGSSTGSGGEVTVAHYEYMYNIDIDAVNTKNTDERARLSMLYQY